MRAARSTSFNFPGNGYQFQFEEVARCLAAGKTQSEIMSWNDSLALARALYDEPALIVLDEPNANLDDAGDAALIKALQELKQEKRTVFVITHRTNVLGVADAIMVLVDGAIQAYGPRDTVAKALMAKQQMLAEAGVEGYCGTQMCYNNEAIAK